MKVRPNGGRRFALLGLSAALVVASQWPQRAAAHHVIGLLPTLPGLDSTTRTVTIDVAESTTGGGSPHSAMNVDWGDGLNSDHAWTSTFGTTSQIYRVFGVSHVYPDLTDRVISVTGDCCNASSAAPVAGVFVQLGCADTPLGGCNATAATAQIQIKNDDSDDSKDKLKFKWLNGTAPAFDDPTASAEYYLCIYAPGLVLQAIVPPVTHWDAAGSSGFKYHDTAAAAGGIANIKLKTGAGNAKILVKGAGTHLSDFPMPLTQPVRVQLQSSAAHCWEHLFTSPEIKNDGALFKDKDP